jgi:superfamily II DNA or RNA helicase
MVTADLDDARPDTGTAAPQPNLTETPQEGDLVHVRGRHWIVQAVDRSSHPHSNVGTPRFDTRVDLLCVDEDSDGETASVIWDLEPDRRLVPSTRFPDADGRWASPAQVSALLDAVRWGAVASADATYLQAPFRSGVSVEPYQVEPALRAIDMPRVNLLLADDVGLGKTIEAGLVIQELILRHRARTVMVVCPPSLCLKWQEEMRTKFGLDFRIVDRSTARQIRKEHGQKINPFGHHPRLIVSLDYLKRPEVMRELRSLPLPDDGGLRFPRRFDVLVVDEVHNIVPAGKNTKSLTLRTECIEEIAPHFEHRIFMSATPHNGHSESWRKLLHLLDPQRFPPETDPDPRAIAEVLVRRLKSDVKADARASFADRKVEPIHYVAPPDVAACMQHIDDYCLERSRNASDRDKVAIRLLRLVLLKRLLSSPAAFTRTLEAHRAKVRVETLSEDDAHDLWDDGDEDFDGLEYQAVALGADASDQHLTALQKHAARLRQNDVKYHALRDFLRSVLVDRAGKWSEKRVVVFTEYRDTQEYLFAQLSRDLPDAAHHIDLLHGGLDQDERARINRQFLDHPKTNPLRLILATDAASEGIDLHVHCDTLVQYDVPFNPSRMEQRIGRIDRHGQRSPTVVAYHMLAVDKEGRPTSDSELLELLIRKVNTQRADLGAVGDVISPVVEAALQDGLSIRDLEHSIDTALARTKTVRLRSPWAGEAGGDAREKVAQRLEHSRSEIHATEPAVRSVVEVALAAVNQPELRFVEHVEPDGTSVPGCYAVDLFGSWRSSIDRDLRSDGSRPPFVFDQDLAGRLETVAVAHIGHPLVQRAAASLRSSIWSPTPVVGNVTVGQAPAELLKEGDDVVVVGCARLVVTGPTGARLHEELIHAAVRYRRGDANRSLYGQQAQRAIIEAALTPRDDLRHPLKESWKRVQEDLHAAIDARREERVQSLAGHLSKRQAAEEAGVIAVFDATRKRIAAEIAELENAQSQLDFGTGEVQEAAARAEALRTRLDNLAAEQGREVAAVRSRYAQPLRWAFPVAVVVAVGPGAGPAAVRTALGGKA